MDDLKLRWNMHYCLTPLVDRHFSSYLSFIIAILKTQIEVAHPSKQLKVFRCRGLTCWDVHLTSPCYSITKLYCVNFKPSIIFINVINFMYMYIITWQCIFYCLESVRNISTVRLKNKSQTDFFRILSPKSRLSHVFFNSW